MRGALIFALQLLEHEFLGIDAEGYVSSILCTPAFMVFFLSLPSPDAHRYEEIFGKNFVFYAYIFHAGLGAGCDLLQIQGLAKISITIFVSLALSILVNLLYKLISIKKKSTSQSVS